MSLLIDGYNVLHIVGIIGRGVGPGTLQRSRLALLNFLAESLEPHEVQQATVVFDAHDERIRLPRVLDHRGITVYFAAEYEDADAMIEELIRADSSPRRLTVVSSDHRIQRAARRRKARPVDADVWYAEVVQQRRRRRRAVAETAVHPPVPLLQEDVNYWIRQFGGESLLRDLVEMEASQTAWPSADEESSPEEPPAEETSADKPSAAEAAEFENHFPPGYAEDLLEDEDLEQ